MFMLQEEWGSPLFNIVGGYMEERIKELEEELEILKVEDNNDSD